MEADHLRRLMATTKEALSKCDDEVVIFLLEKAKRRGINIEGENPVDLAVKGFCELMIESYPPDLTSTIIGHFEDLQQNGRLGTAHTLSVQERMDPFKRYELDCQNGFPKPSKDSLCTNYVIFVEPHDAKSAAKAALADSDDISERNRLTATALMELPTETKSVWYIGETRFYWPKRCRPKCQGYKGNRVLYHLLRDKKFRIITFNMAAAFQSDDVSQGIVKKRLLCIEMLWHINTNLMSVLGKSGSLCKVYGGGLSVTSSASRLYRILERSSLPDLLKWSQQKINGENKYVVCVESFVELEEVKEETKLVHLNRWFPRNGFFSVIPSGTSLKEVIEAPDQTRRVCIEGNSRIVKSSGRLCYYHPLYQPNSPIDIFRLTHNRNRTSPTLLDKDLACKVFKAYSSSSLTQSKWSNQPAESVAHHLAKLVSQVIDVQTGTLASELLRLMNDAESTDGEANEDVDDGMEDAMLKYMKSGGR